LAAAAQTDVASGVAKMEEILDQVMQQNKALTLKAALGDAYKV
jgi:hypothetical protein